MTLQQWFITVSKYVLSKRSTSFQNRKFSYAIKLKNKFKWSLKSNNLGFHIKLLVKDWVEMLFWLESNNYNSLTINKQYFHWCRSGFRVKDLSSLPRNMCRILFKLALLVIGFSDLVELVQFLMTRTSATSENPNVSRKILRHVENNFF